jgi:hypothetical protein
MASLEGPNHGNGLIRKNRKWRARVRHGGPEIYLGRFDTYEEAADMERWYQETYADELAAERAMLQELGKEVARNKRERKVLGL